MTDEQLIEQRVEEFLRGMGIGGRVSPEKLAAKLMVHLLLLEIKVERLTEQLRYTGDE